MNDEVKSKRAQEWENFSVKMTPVISGILDEEDPICLRAYKGEYSSEARRIVDQLLVMDKPKDVAIIRNVVYSIFTLSFCVAWEGGTGRLVLPITEEQVERELGPKENWTKIAERIVKAVSQV